MGLFMGSKMAEAMASKMGLPMGSKMGEVMGWLKENLGPWPSHQVHFHHQHHCLVFFITIIKEHYKTATFNYH
jgi:hypothetical protein